jgi:prepilin-type N-terminal cleavage/methylation domain-containing protein
MISLPRCLKLPVERLKNPKGFTLIELVSVAVISSLLIVIAGVGLSVFFAKYQEINAYVELQKDAMECLNYIRNGLGVGSGEFNQFNGVVSANAMELTGTSNESGSYSGLKLSPPPVELYEEFTNDFIHYYLQDKVIRVNYMHNGVQVSSPLYLFPKRGEIDRVSIESFKVSDANAFNSLYQKKPDEPLCAVNVELKAKVKTAKNKYRYVRFSTVMAIRNMVRPTGAP